MKFQYYLQEPQFRVGNIDVQTVERPKGYRYSIKNGRKKHGFIYTESGKMVDVFTDGISESLSSDAGELVFIPKGCVYTSIYLEENTKIRIIQFDIISGELPEYLSAPAKIELPQVIDLLDDFFRPIRSRTEYHPFYYLSCLYELLWRLEDNYAGMPKKYKKLQPALAEISEHWDENKPVSYYAELCNMSEANLRRLFREYVGMSPIDFRNDIRLTNAQKKLQSGEYNVSEAAYESGFSNLSFFIRLYKHKFGYTPKKE